LTEELIEEQGPEEYEIPEKIFPWFTKKFEKMTKVAHEVGSSPPTYRIVREDFRPRKKWHEERGRWIEVGQDKVIVVTVEGEPPKLSNWQFVATLTPTEQGNLVQTVPGLTEPVPAEYRTSKPHCDYCKKVRSRLDSFIVRHAETGEYRQIGRNCLAKFLGYSSPERVARMATWLANLQDDISAKEKDYFDRVGRSPEYIDLLDFLTMTAAVIDTHGWVSATEARSDPVGRKTATVQHVRLQMGEVRTKPKFASIRITPTGQHKQRALDAIAYARSDQLQPSSDYEHNLKLSTASDAFHHKASGVVASLLNHIGRTEERRIEGERRKQRYEQEKQELQERSSFVGKVGERITLPVFVTRCREVGSQFGVSFMFRMLDEQGNLLVWFASNNVMDPEKWYLLTGTVKKHEVYDGVNQTILTRCVVKEMPAGAPATKTRSTQRPKKTRQPETSLRGVR
jgi:glutaredoxin